MKKYITMIIAAASISTAVSCNRTFDEKDVPSDGTIYVTRTYKAGLDESTKTTIDATGKVTWEQGDVIRYYSQKNGEVKTYTIDAPSAKAELALDVASTANFLIGVYGGTGLIDNLGSSVTIQGAIPAEQTGVFGDHHVAITKTYDVTQQSLTFHNIVSYLKFTLTRADVAKVIFKANDGTQLHGNGSVTVSLPDETPSAAFGSEGGSSITVLNGGAGTFYIATLPCTLAEGFQADCYDAAGAYLGSASTTKAVQVKAGTILNLGIIDTRIEKMYTDLSAEGTANSYIISEPGNYKIKANVKGNSTEPLDGTPAIAEVLWESFGTDVAPSVGDLISDVSFKDGYIRFTASSLKGNALVAVEDRNEDILWSWHIWLTDYRPDISFDTYANDAIMMNRNLGAMSNTIDDPSSFGLFFQWGRKDPFLGRASFDDKSLAKSTAEWPESVDSYKTIQYSVSHPMTFIKGVQNSDAGWVVSSEKTELIWNKVKTKYDPCPAGWVVSEDVWAGVNESKYSVSAEKNGIVLNSAYSTPDAWYPFTGILSDTDGQLYYTSTGNVWSSIEYAKSRYSVFFCYNQNIASSIWAYSGGDIYGRTYTSNNPNGYAVRCMREGLTIASLPKGKMSKTNSTTSSITIEGTIDDGGKPIESAVMYWGLSSIVYTHQMTQTPITISEGRFSITFDGLSKATEYQFRLQLKNAVGENRTSTYKFSTEDISDLSIAGSSNCYIITEEGNYCLKAVKGNSSESVGSVVSAEVLWESFGTNVAPSVGDLVSNVSVDGEYITFRASALKGNASIAAKDASGTILWSWHIWMTDQPADQVYNNGAGTMMDRNLGATSATPGDSRSFGLKYQWGRKDPFMAHADTSYTNTAASTIVWPSSVKSTDKIGTILYATRNPTTYISMCDKNYDWKFSYFEDSDRTRWQNNKTKYDPCPNGYRVPDGGNNGVFYKALRGIENSSAYWDDVNKGMDYSDVMTSGPCWYPCSHRSSSQHVAFYKTCTPAKYWYVYGFVFQSNGDNLWSSCPFAASADYVRCQKIL